MAELQYRPALRSDLQGLVQLFERAMQRSITVSELDWRYFSNPLELGVPTHFVAEDAGEIVGHTGFIPMQYEDDQERRIGALSVGSMVDPKHAGIFPLLYQHLEDAIKGSDCDFLFAFPNRNSATFFKRMFGYTQGSLATFNIPVAALQDPQLNRNSLWTRGLRNRLSAEFIAWRVTAHPSFKYILQTDSCLKRYGEDGMDVLYTNTSLNQLLPADAPFEPKSINIYSTDLHLIKNFKERGYVEVETPNIFVWKWLSSARETGSFNMQMIDSDVF